MENVIILRSSYLLQREGGTATTWAFKHSHHKEGIANVVAALRELDIPYSILDESDFLSTINKLKNQVSHIVIAPELRSCPDNVLNGLLEFSENGGLVFALYDSFYYNRPETGEPQRAITQRITELFQITEENFAETVWFDKAEVYFQETRFSWLTNGLPSHHPYSAKNMLGVTSLGSSLAFHGEILCIETIKFDEKTEPVRKETKLPAFLIREFVSGGIFIYACFNFRKVENYNQIFSNLIKHQLTIQGDDWQPEPVVVKSLKVSRSKRQITEQKSANFFISYRRSDSADIAGRIYDRLISRFGKEVIFKDVDSIPLGVDFKEYLDKQVGECHVLLAIIGNQWLEASTTSGEKRLRDPNDFVRIEIESALERNIPVIPLLVRNAAMPAEENLPTSLRKLVYRNGISIRSDPDFHRDMDRLIKALEGIISQPTSESESIASPDNIIFLDDFSKNKGIPVWRDETSFGEIIDGVYRFGVMKPNKVVWKNYKALNVSNFHASAEINMPLSTRVYSCGIIIRSNDKGIYFFGINNDNRFEFLNRTQNENNEFFMDPLVHWEANMAIRSHGENKIEVNAVSDTFELFVNGAKVSRIVDANHNRGGFGFYVSTYGGGQEVIVEFDNLVIEKR